MKKNSSTRHLAADLFELLGSMRFAVSLLTFICVASIIGTVLQQNQATNGYIDKFGPFWFELFDIFGVVHIYNSWWFLLIMTFLVVSTSLCVLRNAPKMLSDAKSFREYVRASSLRSFHHKVELDSPQSTEQTRHFAEGWLRSHGYRFKVRTDTDGVLLAAKKGSANRLGYIFAHVAIVVICIGGLLDSELPIRLQVWFAGKTPITQNMLISKVPESGRLPLANPSFRSNMLVPDGSSSSNALVNVDDGVLVQPLPFSVKLNRFMVEYYSTGMPSSFKSDVDVTDPQTGKTFNRIIEVNEPLHYKGITVYQSSFDDGGSKLKLVGYPLQGPAFQPFKVNGTVGQTTEISYSNGTESNKLNVAFTGLRVINVENLDGDKPPQPKDILQHVASVAGSAAGAKNKHLQNVGPSVQYRITSADGQSREYTNYMVPMTLDGSLVFLAGVRSSSAEPFRYVRIPADANRSVDEFMRLRAALAQPRLVELAAERFAERNAGGNMTQATLKQAAIGAMTTFARSGLNGLIERVPPADREKVVEFAVPMIQITLAELRDLMRAQQGMPAINHVGLDGQEASQWLQQALLALANLADYPAPVFLALDTFDQVQASVFQVSRSPGKTTVYLGCLFLILGVFSMFYIRDRRIWVWIKPNDGGSQLLAAMTSQRRTLDFNHEFQRFKEALEPLSNSSR